MPYKTPETTRAKNREAVRRYQLRNRDKLRRRQREQRAATREERRVARLAKRDILNAKARAYYAANRKAIRARHAARYFANLEKSRAEGRAYTLKYDQRHPGIRTLITRRWRHGHPEAARAVGKRHRALKRGAPISDFTAHQWREMQQVFDHRCAYCHKRAKGKLTQDHITPLSKGGNHTKQNIVPACRNCNSKKYNGPILAPVQPLLL